MMVGDERLELPTSSV